MVTSKERYHTDPEYRRKTLERSRQIRADVSKARKWVLEQLGGQCSRCAYNKCYAALEIHHKNGINPFRYLTRHTKRLNYNKRERWLVTCWRKKEIPHKENLELLCANCHRELHN